MAGSVECLDWDRFEVSFGKGDPGEHFQKLRADTYGRTGMPAMKLLIVNETVFVEQWQRMNWWPGLM